MQTLNPYFKRKLVYLIIFAIVVLGTLIVALLSLQQNVEKRFTTLEEPRSASMSVYKSPDEEYKSVGTGLTLSSQHATMIATIQFY